MSRKSAPIPADPDDPDDFDLTSEDVSRALLAREVRMARQASGLTQDTFARRHGVALGTLRDWEQARSTPPLYAVAFLRLAARDPLAHREIDALRDCVA